MFSTARQKGARGYFFRVVILVFTSVFLIAGDLQATEKPSPYRLPEVCDYIVQHANRGALENIITRPVDIDVMRSMLDNASDVLRRNDGNGYLVDVNNDGKLEQFYVDYKGSLRLSRVEIYSKDGKEKMDVALTIMGEEEDTSYSAIEVIRHQEKTYLLTTSYDSPELLFLVSPNNRGSAVCRFGKKKEPMQLLTKSQDNAICQAALKGDLTYVDFDSELKLEREEPLKLGIHAAYPDQDAALIDVDNDGKKELVVQSEYLVNCSYFFLTAMKQGGKEIDEVLSKRLPQGGCGSEVNPFIYRDKTYLEIVDQNAKFGTREIVLIDRDKKTEICVFKVTPVHYVVDEAEWIVRAAGDDWSPWEYAILKKQSLSMVQALIKSGRNPNDKSGNTGDPPLQMAVFQGRDDILDVLLKNGADPREKGEFLTVLEEAVWRGTERSVEMLLKYGAKDTPDGRAMSEAVYRGTISKLKMLLESGIPVTDEAAILSVQQHGQDAREKLRLLISKGLKVNSSYEKYVLTKGIQQVSPGVYSVGPDFETKKVRMPLIEWAMQSKDPEILRILREEQEKQR
jgi:hypothetical protein